MNKIITDEKLLRNKCVDVSLEEGELIAAQLFDVLSTSEAGVAIAANQIGIEKNVVVINVKEPIYLINPKITNQSGEIYYDEGCLSFPGKSAKTKRFSTIEVSADNYPAGVCFTSLSRNEIDMLECVAAQHELDHLNGITMFDREVKLEPIKSERKFGRNEKVTITRDEEKRELKWKKAESLILSGNWKLFIED
jgi:peptide deformylase